MQMECQKELVALSPERIGEMEETQIREHLKMVLKKLREVLASNL